MTFRIHNIARFAATIGVLTLFWGLSYMPPASALPPGGAATVNTPGTSSSVSPSSVEQCGSVSYEVSGFPAGETVNVKIDDGNVSGGDKSVQGQGVVDEQAIGNDGRASGSVEISCDFPTGMHTLRFLATGGPRNEGYTNRSPEFEVTAKSGGGGESGDSNNSDSGASDSNSGDSTSGATSAGGTRSNNSASGGGTASRGNTASGSRGNTASDDDDDDDDEDESTSSGGGGGASGGTARAGGGGGATSAGGSGVAPVPAAPAVVPAAAPRVAVVAVAEAAVDPALVARTRRQAKTVAAAVPRKHPVPKPQDQPRTQPVVRPRPAVSPIKSRRKNPTTTATGHPTAASSTRPHKMRKSPQPRTRYRTLGSLLGAQSCSLV